MLSLECALGVCFSGLCRTNILTRVSHPLLRTLLETKVDAIRLLEVLVRGALHPNREVRPLRHNLALIIMLLSLFRLRRT